MELIVQRREQLGKGLRKLRKEGFIPAELYGHGIENIHLAVPVKEFSKVFKEAGENTVVNVKIGDESRPVLIYYTERDPLSDKFLSIDLYQVRMDEKIETTVPIEFIGESPLVKEKGAVLVKTTEEVEVEALPFNIPHHIEVDLSVLTELDQTIYVRDLKVEGDFEIQTPPETPIVTTSEIEEEEEPEATEEESAQIEKIEVEGAAQKTQKEETEPEEGKAKKES